MRGKVIPQGMQETPFIRDICCFWKQRPFVLVTSHTQHIRDSHRCRPHPLISGRNDLLSTPRRHPPAKRRSTHNKKHSAPEPSAVWDAPYSSVSNTEELARPCIQAGFQGGDTSVEFRSVCSQALLFRFRRSDLGTQFPQALQVTV